MNKLAKAVMPIAIAVTLLILGTATASMAGNYVPPAPEIDVATGASAIAVLGGAVLIVRGRRKK